MQPADIALLISVSSPAVSPDGRRVAFVVTHVDLDANRYRSAVWLADADGSSAPYPLTAGEHDDGNPTWSPDGRRLAFTRTADGSGSLHVVPVDGPGETVTVCTRPEAVEEPRWSPDGARIAFASRERAARYSEGDDDRARPPRRIDRLFSRLDGTGWTIDRPRGVFVVAADGSAAPVPALTGPYDVGGPVWSADGSQLVVAAVRGPDGDLDLRADLHLVDADGVAAPRALTESTVSYSHPAVATDGLRVAALTEDMALVPSHTQVSVVQDGVERVLTAGLDRQCAPFPGARAPLWSGEDLLFSIEDHGDVHVYRVPADGSRSPEPVLTGTRAITAFDAAGDTLAFVASTPTTRPELFVRDADGTERKLTRLSAAFHAAVEVHEPEPFTVEGVDAWVLRPAGAQGPVPVLLSIHGGPMTQYANAWFDEFQLWASAGYAVVYANPHGSTGYDEAWSREIRSPEAAVAPGTGWAGRAAADVLAALDAALARHPELDPDRVGVLGGSYGGYLTTWLVAHTDRFAAACSERAANNLESLEWDSDVSGHFRHEIGVSHLDAPEVYRDMSPVHRARDIHTPVLILHSEDDLRCPVGQADQLFVALRLLGREVEYWRFPEEGHGLSRAGSPRHRVQRAEIILDWFGRHLGGTRPRITWDHPSREQVSR